MKNKLKTNNRFRFRFTYRFIILLVVLNTLNVNWNMNLNAKIPIQIQNIENQIFETKHNDLNKAKCSYPEQTYKRLNKLDKNNKIQISQVKESNYDVLSYDLFVDWYNLFDEKIELKVKEFAGLQVMKIAITKDNTNSIEINTLTMNVNSVRLIDKNSKIDLEYSIIEADDNSEPNVITLDKTYNINDTISIEIAYLHNTPMQLGFQYYSTSAVSIPYPIGYTMSEPENARNWMPCKDRPDDKAFSKISIRMPIGYTAISNGLLVDSAKTDSSIVYVWENDIPIPTYLMHIIASKFYKWTDYFQRKGQFNDSIEVSYYAWEQDLPEFNSKSKYKPRESMQPTVAMLEFLSNYLNEYPYQKYSQASAFPFQYGGMEHQTITTVNRSWLQNNAELGVMHEVGHHWLGNMISCATWNDVWINEGGATWTEWLWLDEAYNNDLYKSYVTSSTVSLTSKTQIALNNSIYGIEPNMIFTGQNQVLVYTKAGLIYNMLNRILGEDFRIALTNTLEEYKFKSLTTNEFRNSLKKYLLQLNNTKIDIDLFFEEWVYGSGHPIYQINSKYDIVDGKYKLSVNLNQIQKETNPNSKVKEVYKTPITVVITTEKDGVFKDIYKEMSINNKIENFEIILDDEPIDVDIDITAIIRTVVVNPLGISNPTISENNGISIYPNPASKDNLVTLRKYYTTSNIEANLENENNDFDIINSYEIYDITGNLVETKININLSQTILDIQNLSIGNYIVKVNSNNKITFQKLTIID